MANIELVVKFGDNETLIYQRGKGIICREASKIAFSRRGKRVYLEEFGQKAKDCIGKTDGTIIIDSPFSLSAISNLDLAELYFRTLLETYVDKRFGSKYFVIFLISGALTSEERRMYEILAINCGIRKYVFVPEVIADLLGFDEVLDDIDGKMLVNIGAECTEMALISNGSIINGYSIELGGGVLDKEISNFLYREYNVVVNEVVAEKIKKEIGSLYSSDVSSVSFMGYDALTRMAKKNTLLAKDIFPILNIFYDKICEGILIFLNQISLEFVNDISKNGIYLTGGSSLIAGIEQYFKEKVGIKVNQVVDISKNFSISSKKLLENKSMLKKIVNKN